MGTVTATGYQKDRIADIRSDLQADLVAKYGSGFVLDESNAAIVFEGIMSERFALLEEALETLSFMPFPNSAVGIYLDQAVSITGFARQPATNSDAIALAVGTPSTTITKDSTVSVDIAGDFFNVDADYLLGPIGTLSIGVGDLTSTGTTATVAFVAHGFSDGDYFFVSGADQPEYNSVDGEPYIVTNASANSFDFIFAGSATSPATGTIEVKEGTLIGLVAQETGPVQALAGSITVIETPIAGWDEVWNFDATLGQNIETDAELRTRREENLGQLAGGTIESIKGKLLNVSGVTSAVVFENDTGVILPSGQVPYSIQCFVTGGADQDIIDTIGLDGKSGGIATYGTESGVAIDSEGNLHAIYFSRLTSVTIYIDTTIVKNTVAEDGPVFDDINGPTDIKTAIAAYGDTLEPGADVWENQIRAAIGSVAGVKSVTALLIDIIFPPVATGNVAIASTEVANIDTSNIDVTVT